MYNSAYFCLPSVTCFPPSLQHLVNLFARLANDNIGYIDWDPYIPKVCCCCFSFHHPLRNLVLGCYSFAAHFLMCGLTLMIWAHGVYFMAIAACQRSKLSCFLVAVALAQ